MANPFYTPSGNPATGSEGLSALIRGEFASIGTAFDLMPRIGTTGLFDTVFNQQGSYTFTLPSGPGTFALTADVTTAVSVETARATAAEAANATAITAEATTRAAADTAETTARTTEISAEATTRSTADTTETTRAMAAEALLAPLASPALTGAPTAPTATSGTNTTQLATTAFTTTAVATETTRATTAEALLAPKASPALTGTPTAPTAGPGTNTTQVATTAFTTAAVLVETTRAQTAEATKQASLGFSPVQQGTGVGQTTNVVKVGYNGSGKTKITIDATDFGNIAMESWVLGTIHDVTSSRVLGTTYTNTTGKMMFLSVFVGLLGTSSPNAVDVNVTVDGTQAYYDITNVAFGGSANYGVTGIAFVPPNSTYKVGSLATSPSMLWKETW